jgi:guanyl-specific ribonuclease Sa
LLGALLLVLLSIGYRSCREAGVLPFADRLPAGLAPRGPESNPPPGLIGIASLQLSQAPRHVQRVVHHLRNVRHWRPLRGFKGGRRFRNLEGTLPRGRSYFEYDVHALRPGVSRGAERLVVDESKQFFYYTRDHYTTFTQLRLP